VARGPTTLCGSLQGERKEKRKEEEKKRKEERRVDRRLASYVDRVSRRNPGYLPGSAFRRRKKKKGKRRGKAPKKGSRVGCDLLFCIWSACVSETLQSAPYRFYPSGEGEKGEREKKKKGKEEATGIC